MNATSAQTVEVVLLIHGIRTHASWAEMVAQLIETGTNTQVIAVKYGFFDTLRFLSPFFTRRGPIKRIIREYRDARVRYPGAKISIIAHSFGTYAVAKALEEPDFELHRVIFCGSIAPNSLRVATYRAQLGDDPILNDCGTHDIYPVLAQSVTWGYGATGTFGFGTTGIRDRFSKFSHSSYFDTDFVKTYWLPFIAHGTIVPTDWEIKRSTPPYWQSLLSWLPLKWLPPFIFGVVVVWAGSDLLGSQPVAVTVAKQAYIGHWLGISNVDLQLLINNKSATTTQIFVPSISLRAPTSDTDIQLPIEGIINCDGSVPQTWYVTVEAHRTTTCRLLFFGICK